ncbi:MAG: hypothetical protein BRD27_01475, partial [Bacteroidetes bacterium QH_10_64_19]
MRYGCVVGVEFQPPTKELSTTDANSHTDHELNFDLSRAAPLRFSATSPLRDLSQDQAYSLANAAASDALR